MCRQNPRRPRDRAARTRGDREIAQRHDQRFAFNEVKTDIQVTGDAMIEISVDIDFFHVIQAVVESVA
jgi:hypothetical protein